MNVIDVKNLTKEYVYTEKEAGLKGSVKGLFRSEKKVKKAVSDLSFSIEQGKIVGFLGPNGAGKTTTLKMLSGIMYPSSGQAEVLGYTPWERQNRYKRQISIVLGQKNQLWWDLPAIESLYLNKCIYKIPDDIYKTKINELCDVLDVQDLLNVQVRNLSLGERMKMELIAALLHSPKIIFLDEPTIGLDFMAQKNIREFLMEYNRKEKTTIMLTSHYMADIENMCDRAIVINHGNLVFDGKLHEISEIMNEKKTMTFRFSENVEGLNLYNIAEIKSIKDNMVEFSVERDEVQHIASHMLKNYSIVDFNVEDVPLEEGLAMLYQGKEK